MYYDEELDATALVCPLPLVHTKKKLKTMQSGRILKVITQDPSSVIDFKAYASVSGHTLLVYEEINEKYYFYLKCK